MPHSRPGPHPESIRVASRIAPDRQAALERAEAPESPTGRARWGRPTGSRRCAPTAPGPAPPIVPRGTSRAPQRIRPPRPPPRHIPESHPRRPDRPGCHPGHTPSLPVNPELTGPPAARRCPARAGPPRARPGYTRDDPGMTRDEPGQPGTSRSIPDKAGLARDIPGSIPDNPGQGRRVPDSSGLAPGKAGQPGGIPGKAGRADTVRLSPGSGPGKAGAWRARPAGARAGSDGELGAGYGWAGGAVGARAGLGRVPPARAGRVSLGAGGGWAGRSSAPVQTGPGRGELGGVWQLGDTRQPGYAGLTLASHPD
jgi:translation initiation factor IF-2